MKARIQQLINLQELDSAIIAKRLYIDKSPGRISEVDGPLTLARQSLEKMQQKNDALLKKKRDREKTLEDINEKIKKMKTRTSDIKTNKEYQAHLKEIEASEKEIGSIEEEVLTIMEELDQAAKVRKTGDENVKMEIARLDAAKKEIEAEIEGHKKELAALKEKRTAMVSSLNPDDYSIYMRLLRDGGGVAISPAKNEICGGCDMNMPPQLFVELRKNEELIQCPQCYRILYYRED